QTVLHSPTYVADPLYACGSLLSLQDNLFCNVWGTGAITLLSFIFVPLISALNSIRYISFAFA
ncbi:MAG TPA: hypothetical protein VM187_09685, partial [Niastella sp.]|nr:hypothetical protein [Niastella sp.]